MAPATKHSQQPPPQISPEDKRKNRIETELNERISDIQNWQGEEGFDLPALVKAREEQLPIHNQETARASPLWSEYEALIQEKSNLTQLPVSAQS